MTSARNARGSASLLVVVLTGLVVLLGLAGAFVTATVVAHRRAQSAADLAALAGAAARESGRSGCEVASRVAAANGGRLVVCRSEGTQVVVSVTVEGPRFAGRGFTPEGRARAGPAG